MEINKFAEEMFSTMKNIFHMGKFSEYLYEVNINLAALKEYEEAETFFYRYVGWYPEYFEEIEKESFFLKEDKKAVFLAMRDIFYGGEFSEWLKKQDLCNQALEEYNKAKEYFFTYVEWNPNN